MSEIAIVGGGNVGTQFAAHSASKGHRVKILTSTPLGFSDELVVVDKNGNQICSGSIELVSDDPAEVIKGADYVFVTTPAFAAEAISSKVLPYANESMTICHVPGTGGVEHAFHSCTEKGASFFGLERVPAVARIVKRGESVRAIGYRDELHIASVGSARNGTLKNLLEDLFSVSVKVLPNYLNITMTPSNPILHTTRLRVLFQDWSDGILYSRIPLFYEEWDDESSELLLACDAELQNICQDLENVDLSSVVSLKEHYESNNAYTLTRKLKSIEGFKGILAPMKEVEGGFIPDFQSRYFTADFSYGLAILIEIASITKTSTPMMISVLDWFRSLPCQGSEFSFSRYGIQDKEDLVRYYSQ